jgi:hypothetical protein
MEAISASKSHLPVHTVSSSQKAVTLYHCCENLKTYIKLYKKKVHQIYVKATLQLDILNATTEACAAATSETWFESQSEY